MRIRQLAMAGAVLLASSAAAVAQQPAVSLANRLTCAAGNAA